jgi:hypothetical protein
MPRLIHKLQYLKSNSKSRKISEVGQFAINRLIGS